MRAVPISTFLWLSLVLAAFTSVAFFLSNPASSRARLSLGRPWNPSKDWQWTPTTYKAPHLPSITASALSTQPTPTSYPNSSSSTLPPCPRTMEYSYGGSRGFMSTYTSFIMHATIATHFQYELKIVPTSFIYGSYHDYFVEPERNCSLDVQVRRRVSMDPIRGDDIASPAWAKADHVTTGHSMDYIDDLFLSLAISSSSLDAIHRSELETYPRDLPLEGSETVPMEMWKAFELQAKEVERWWKLHPEVQSMVDVMRGRLGWTRDAGEEGEEGGRTVIGVHMRLGDKCAETGSNKYNPLRFASPSQLASHRLLHAPTPHCQSNSSSPDPSTSQMFLSAIHSSIKEIESTSDSSSRFSKPLVALMSDDEDSISQLHVVDGSFELISLTAVAKEVEGAQGGAGGSDMGVLEKGFRGGAFLKTSMETRIASTRMMLRDLTLLGERADALVFTASSNVGRVLALLGGLEKAKAGRDRSCDQRWFPTAHFN